MLELTSSERFHLMMNASYANQKITTARNNLEQSLKTKYKDEWELYLFILQQGGKEYDTKIVNRYAKLCEMNNKYFKYLYPNMAPHEKKNYSKLY